MTAKDILEVISTYSISHCDFPNNLVTGNKRNAVGYCDHETRKIYIDKNIAPQSVKLIVLHELVHAWLHLNGKKDGEKITNKITNQIYKELYPDE